MGMLCSCHKKKEEIKTPTPPPTPVVDMPDNYFYPLKTGNYWVYKRTEVMGSGPTANTTITMDTIRITYDTIINGQRNYYFTDGVWEGIYAGFYADSAGYILNNGFVQAFIDLKPNDTLWRDSTPNYIIQTMRSPLTDTTITVPLGTYACWQTIQEVYFVNGTGNPDVPNPRTARRFYARNVGLIKSYAFYSNTPGGITAELVEVHLER